MTTAERDRLLLVLAIASGSADGWSYFGLGHAFVANMTGNTVLLGISLFHINGDVVHPLVSLAGYFLGTAAGTFLNRRVKSGTVWARPVSLTLFLEALLLVGAEAEWVATSSHPDNALKSVLLGSVAVAIGLQSGAMLQLGIPGVVTTYITGTWTKLTSGLILLWNRQPRVVKDAVKFEERFWLQGKVLIAYFLSAALTGWGFRFQEWLVGSISAFAVLLAASYSTLRS